jgi:hypothetical protein
MDFTGKGNAKKVNRRSMDSRIKDLNNVIAIAGFGHVFGYPKDL